MFVRTTCNDPATEIGCADLQYGGLPEELQVDVTAGVPVYVYVGGFTQYDAGPYDLTIATAAHQCGDGLVTGTETCDDGNTSGGDGCDGSCVLEVTETEPNDVQGDADANLNALEVGLIDVPGDMDWWSFDVTVPASATIELTARVTDVEEVFGSDLGVGLCDAFTLDSEVEIYDSNGVSIAFNDDDYTFCSTAVATVTTSGTYYVRVASSQVYWPQGEFGYGLEITQQAVVCGDGIQTASEQCDDGNSDDGDGCSAACVVEFCGDGVTNNTDEACDDGNTVDGDGCRADCLGLEVCGDGLIDTVTGERCDDGNNNTGDGCDDQCVPEPDEVETNDDYTTANPYVDPFIGRIDPIGDQDYISIDLPHASNSLVLETSDMGGLGSCSTLGSFYGYTYPIPSIDTVLDLYDTDGTTLLETDDNDGPDTCSRIVYTGLPAGTYYIRVAESTVYTYYGYTYTTPASDVFDYMLHASFFPEVCGDGIEAPLEQCDDSNNIDGDGCSATCMLENVGFTGCTGGTLTEINGTALGVAILDNTLSTSMLNSTDTATIQDVRVRIDDLDHTYDADLVIALVSPAGTRVVLSEFNGGSNDDYTATVFDDQCTVLDGPIGNGTAPFTGCFAPTARSRTSSGRPRPATGPSRSRTSRSPTPAP